MTVIHLAKPFANGTPSCTMAFGAYDGAERGLRGALAFVNDVVKTAQSPYGDVEIVGTVDLDMIGINWPGTMAPVVVLANSEAIAKTADDKRLSMEWPDDQWHRKPNLNEAG